MTRRALWGGALAAPFVRARAQAPAAGAGGVRLGGPIFLKSDDPGELAREHRRLGYSAAYCPAVKLAENEKVRAIEKSFADAGVAIAEVGAWSNMLDPDAEKRKRAMALVEERLALADAVGALNCVNISGSYNKDVWYGPHPGNLSPGFFDATVENCRKLVDAVKPKRARFSLEMMPWSLPEGPDSYLRLIKAVDRPAFAVHMDICNAINSPERFYNNSAFVAECFSKLGRWIESCHAKDLEWKTEYNVHFAEVVPGRGGVDYAAYLRELARLPRRPPLMLEHLRTAEEYAEGAGFIRKVAAQNGVSIA
jgi:sugar phosphate isomerase/epimerase